ncbi:MAG: putative metal-binding motif-containing protein [Alphaproteobacteria bacterium]|nr:putative metal-binding motif-containing protein [Alphaproteobacteria bacterium]
MLPMVLLFACTSSDKAPGAGIEDDTGVGGHDSGCDAPLVWAMDADDDGYGTAADTVEACDAPDGFVDNTSDCDDADPAVHPGADERCNGIDDDCDGVVDPDGALDATTCHVDGDGDGYGDPSATADACDCTDGLVDDDTDCDDTDASVFPGASEVPYDGIDQACDGDAGEYDRDGDGYNLAGSGAEPEGDCDDGDPAINPGMLDWCDDDIDQDCDGVIDECGLPDVATPDDAWWILERESFDGAPSGILGKHTLFAGDSDGDGSPEILVKETQVSGGVEVGFCRFHLVEAPARTSGGREILGAESLAIWDLPVPIEKSCESHAGDVLSVADVDLDLDGYPDFILTPGILTLDEESASVYLSYGPVSGEVDVGTLDHIHRDARFKFLMPSRVIEAPSEGSDWVIAQSTWAGQFDDEGSYRPAILLLGPAHFTGDLAWSNAPAIWTDGDGREIDDTLIAEDFDGDGIRDLVTTTQRYDVDVPSPRVWFLRGPFEADTLSLADADVIIDQGEDSTSFGLTVDILDDLDGDGHRSLIVGEPAWGPGQTDAYHLFEPSEFADDSLLDTDDAYARIAATGDIDDDDAITPAYYGVELVRDIDADGHDELAITVYAPDAFHVHLMDEPTAGVVDLGDPLYVLTSDDDIDDAAGFGSRIIGDHDLDGDGAVDLLIGEWYWDGDPENYYHPFGRLMVFRGEVLD